MSKNAANKLRAKRARRNEFSRYPIGKANWSRFLQGMAPSETPLIEALERAYKNG